MRQRSFESDDKSLDVPPSRPVAFLLIASSLMILLVSILAGLWIEVAA